MLTNLTRRDLVFVALSTALTLVACSSPKATSVGAAASGPRELTYTAFAEAHPTEVSSPFAAMLLTKTVAATCDPIPSQQVINRGPWEYRDLYISRKRAAAFDVRVVNASGKDDYLVIVRDYRRGTECTATDGKTRLVYGQLIRAVLELSEYDASAKTSLPFVAANATLSGKQQFFYLQKDGFYHPDVDKILGEVSGKVFDVETYGLYQGILPRILTLLSQPNADIAPSRIEVIPPDDDPAFVYSSARAYAFNRILDGQSCARASVKFAKDDGRLAAVIEAYAFMGLTGCTNDPPNAVAKDRAKQLLGGVSAK